MYCFNPFLIRNYHGITRNTRQSILLTVIGYLHIAHFFCISNLLFHISVRLSKCRRISMTREDDRPMLPI